MTKTRNKLLCLMLCIILVLCLCGAQILGNSLLILSTCFLFLLLTAGASLHKEALPVLLFFLPWSTLLKLTPDSKSFYTIALILVCVIQFIRSKLSVNSLCLLSAILIFALSITSKLMDGSGLSFSYLMFLVMLVLFPNLCREKSEFSTLTLFFSTGIFLAALAAKNFAALPLIGRYITIHSGEGVLRYSGFYGDANFYSAHISAAIAALSLMILKEKHRLHRFFCGAMIFALLYCGSLAASKAFFLTICLLFLMWFPLVMRKKSWRFRIIALLLLLISGMSILVFGWLDTLFFRLQNISNLSSLTTGRTELWMDYLRSLITEPKVFLLGVGLSGGKLHGVSSHNTILQALYQLGLLGSGAMAAWMLAFLHEALPSKWYRTFPQALMLAIGCFLPWMALDLLFFDEFFLLPLFWAAGCQYAMKGEDIYGTNAADHSSGTAEYSDETSGNHLSRSFTGYGNRLSQR